MAIDLGDVPTPRRGVFRWLPGFVFSAPLSRRQRCFWWWHRSPARQTCASLLIRVKKLSALSYQLSVKSELWPAHAQLLDGLQIEGELLRSRMQTETGAIGHCSIRHKGGKNFVGRRRLRSEGLAIVQFCHPLRGRDALATAGGTPALQIRDD